jgi:hypothetical protein
MWVVMIIFAESRLDVGDSWIRLGGVVAGALATIVPVYWCINRNIESLRVAGFFVRRKQ